MYILYKHADIDGKIRRFSSMKTEWGFDRFLRIQTLTDPSNGYIRDDFCLFGAEVFVIKRIPIPSALTDDVNPCIWKVEKFSTIKDTEYYYSKNFVAGGRLGKQNPRLRLHAEFKLRMKNQVNNTYLSGANL